MAKAKAQREKINQLSGPRKELIEGLPPNTADWTEEDSRIYAQRRFDKGSRGSKKEKS